MKHGKHKETMNGDITSVSVHWHCNWAVLVIPGRLKIQDVKLQHMTVLTPDSAYASANIKLPSILRQFCISHCPTISRLAISDPASSAPRNINMIIYINIIRSNQTVILTQYQSHPFKLRRETFYRERITENSWKTWRV